MASAYHARVALTVYHYPNCSTCKKALAWLAAQKIAYTPIDIVKHPPSKAELQRAAKLAGVPVGKLFNVSGVSYREGDFKTKLATMTDAQAFAALAADGKLVKRPLALTADAALVGFREDAWASALAR
jgi:arsenate reductase